MISTYNIYNKVYMKCNRFTWILSLLGMMMASCSEGDDMVNETVPQQCDILFSVGKSAGMRMASDVVTATTSRDLQKLLVIPFQTEGAADVVGTDVPLISTAETSDFTKVETGSTHYYSANSQLMKGTNRVLAYGQAAKVSGKESEAQNGTLETTLVSRMMPSDITFNLKSICGTTTANEDAQALADYLTAIANTEEWSMTSNVSLKTLYRQFIQIDAEGMGIMAGSAANVKQYVAALESQLGADELSVKIKAKINSDAKSCLTNGYPSASTSLGLPDGAAALRWIESEKAFSVRTTTTTLDNINGIHRYTYPAELWFYTNSGIKTSNTEVKKEDYEGRTWDWLLTNKYKDNTFVSVDTRSVAVENQLQYAVALLQTNLTPIGETQVLFDAKGVEVANAQTETLPLKGIIIGNQHTVGFDFKPQLPKSDVDARIIYDKEVTTTGTNNTLVLQSYDGEKVPVVLEFENKTGNAFTGKDGIIYPDTKFYLIAQLDPAGKGEGDCAGRVFTQDYITTVTMKIESLANAYSCMPDLLSPRLEIGVQVVTQWILSTPTIVKL